MVGADGVAMDITDITDITAVVVGTVDITAELAADVDRELAVAATAGRVGDNLLRLDS